MQIHTEDVAFGRFHRAESGDGLPGVVLVHDVWGPSEHSAALAADWAREGFGVLEIDLYRHLDAVAIEDVGAWIRGLSDPAIVADLEAGANWLADDTAACRGRPVAITGVCMGGMFALLAACLSDRFAAAAPFYGMLSYDEGMLAAEAGRDASKKPTSPIEGA
ncbi:MAG: dienelactone hydrolase family protein, partial [Myxococcota bacterium]